MNGLCELIEMLLRPFEILADVIKIVTIRKVLEFLDFYKNI